jgi:hypothetical protein
MPIYAVQHPRRANTSFTSRQKLEITQSEKKTEYITMYKLPNKTGIFSFMSVNLYIKEQAKLSLTL